MAGRLIEYKTSKNPRRYISPGIFILQKSFGCLQTDYVFLIH